jgi:hypothetical protein
LEDCPPLAAVEAELLDVHPPDKASAQATIAKDGAAVVKSTRGVQPRGEWSMGVSVLIETSNMRILHRVVDVEPTRRSGTT